MGGDLAPGSMPLRHIPLATSLGGEKCPFVSPPFKIDSVAVFGIWRQAIKRLFETLLLGLLYDTRSLQRLNNCPHLGARIPD
jgi:hypothetical protein